MKKLNSNQSGVAHIFAIILVAVIAVVGFAGWKVYKNQAKPAPTTVAVAKKVQTPTPAAAEKNTLKTYSNSTYGFSFEYPASWTITEDLKDSGRGGKEGDIVATSPLGTKVHFGPNFGGKGGDCVDPETSTYTTKNCSTQTVYSITKLASSTTAGPVYFYHMSLKAPNSQVGGKTVYYVTIENGESRPTKTGTTIGAFIYPYDEIMLKNTTYLTVYVDGKDDGQNTSAAYFSTNQVKEATPVLRSFKEL